MPKFKKTTLAGINMPKNNKKTGICRAQLQYKDIEIGLTFEYYDFNTLLAGLSSFTSEIDKNIYVFNARHQDTIKILAQICRKVIQKNPVHRIHLEESNNQIRLWDVGKQFSNIEEILLDVSENSDTLVLSKVFTSSDLYQWLIDLGNNLELKVAPKTGKISSPLVTILEDIESTPNPKKKSKTTKLVETLIKQRKFINSEQDVLPNNDTSEQYNSQGQKT